MKTRLTTLVLALTSLAGTMSAQATLITWFAPNWQAQSLTPKEAKKFLDRFVSKDRLCTIDVRRPEGKGIRVVAYDETRLLKEEITINHSKPKVSFFRKSKRDDGWHPASRNEYDLFVLNYARSAEAQLPSWVIRSFGGAYIRRWN